eukprot:7216393-Pyramimonas_sp.AAC.2
MQSPQYVSSIVAIASPSAITCARLDSLVRVHLVHEVVVRGLPPWLRVQQVGLLRCNMTDVLRVVRAHPEQLYVPEGLKPLVREIDPDFFLNQDGVYNTNL